MRNARQRGHHWELRAEAFLRRRGLRTVSRNFQARVGEIDLVMMDGDTLVFAEVRYRAAQGHGCGAESVTRPKQQRIIRAAKYYLACHPENHGLHCRFDVVAIGRFDGRTVYRWIQNAFEAG